MDEENDGAAHERTNVSLWSEKRKPFENIKQAHTFRWKYLWLANTDISISLKTHTHSYGYCHHRHSFRLHSSNSGMFFPLFLFSIFGFDFKQTFELKLTAFDFGKIHFVKWVRTSFFVDCCCWCCFVKLNATYPLSFYVVEKAKIH